MIRARYLATDSARGSSGTFVWFIEEVGELASALGEEARGNGNRANLEEEFADVFAWLCTLANIHGVDLTDALNRKYTVGGGPKGTKT
jgi:NTP pyrophosphatase (non-canonical NTP hydrolase)